NRRRTLHARPGGDRRGPVRAGRKVVPGRGCAASGAVRPRRRDGGLSGEAEPGAAGPLGRLLRGWLLAPPLGLPLWARRLLATARLAPLGPHAGSRRAGDALRALADAALRRP